MAKSYVHSHPFHSAVLASISRAELNDFIEREAADEWLFKEKIARLRNAMS